MRFLHLGLVVSLVLSTKASDDPNHDDSVSENPTGRATVHGHPKVAAGSGRPKPISETPLMSREADSEKHTMPPVMTEDNAMMLSDELTNAHESNEALIEEMSEQDKVISVHEFKEVLHELVKDAIDKIVMKKAGIMGKLKTAKQNLIGQVGEATGRDPQAQSNLFKDISIEADSEEHSMSPVMTEDNTMMLSEEVQLTNAHESNKAMIEEISEHDKVISEALLALFPGYTKDEINELPLESVFQNLIPNSLRFGDLTIKTGKQNFVCQDGEATGLDLHPGMVVTPSGHLTIIIDRFICLCDQNDPENACISCRHIPDEILPGGIFFHDKTFFDELFPEGSFLKLFFPVGSLPS